VILTFNAIGIADGSDRAVWAASNRLRFLGAPLLAPDFVAAGDSSVLSMVAQVQGGIPPRREPH